MHAGPHETCPICAKQKAQPAPAKPECECGKIFGTCEHPEYCVKRAEHEFLVHDFGWPYPHKRRVTAIERECLTLLNQCRLETCTTQLANEIESLLRRHGCLTTPPANDKGENKI